MPAVDVRLVDVVKRFGETALPRVRSFVELSEERRAEVTAKAEATLSAHYERVIQEQSGQPGGGVRGQ